MVGAGFRAQAEADTQRDLLAHGQERRLIDREVSVPVVLGGRPVGDFLELDLRLKGFNTRIFSAFGAALPLNVCG